mgnify:CR=1 FL=1
MMDIHEKKVLISLAENIISYSNEQPGLQELARIALAALTAEPVKMPVSSTDWVFIRFTDASKNQRMKCKIEWTDGYNSVIYDQEGAPLLLSNNSFEVLRLNAIDNTAQQYEALAKDDVC